MGRQGTGSSLHIPGLAGAFRQRHGHDRQALEHEPIAVPEAVHGLYIGCRADRQAGVLIGQRGGMSLVAVRDDGAGGGVHITIGGRRRIW